MFDLFVSLTRTKVNAWISEWMNEWMNKWINRQTKRQTDRQTTILLVFILRHPLAESSRHRLLTEINRLTISNKMKESIVTSAAVCDPSGTPDCFVALDSAGSSRLSDSRDLRMSLLGCDAGHLLTMRSQQIHTALLSILLSKLHAIFMLGGQTDKTHTHTDQRR